VLGESAFKVKLSLFFIKSEAGRRWQKDLPFVLIKQMQSWIKGKSFIMLNAFENLNLDTNL